MSHRDTSLFTLRLPLFHVLPARPPAVCMILAIEATISCIETPSSGNRTTKYGRLNDNNVIADHSLRNLGSLKEATSLESEFQLHSPRSHARHLFRKREEHYRPTTPFQKPKPGDCGRGCKSLDVCHVAQMGGQQQCSRSPRWFRAHKRAKIFSEAAYAETERKCHFSSTRATDFFANVRCRKRYTRKWF